MSVTGDAKTANLVHQIDIIETEVETMRGGQTFCSGLRTNLSLRFADLLPENIFVLEERSRILSGTRRRTNPENFIADFHHILLCQLQRENGYNRS